MLAFFGRNGMGSRLPAHIKYKLQDHKSQGHKLQGHKSQGHKSQGRKSQGHTLQGHVKVKGYPINFLLEIMLRL